MGTKMLNVIIFILIAVLLRISPHPWNFTPILSIALLSGAYFKNKLSFIIPFSIIVISDLYIGNFNMAFWVYISYLLIFMLGRLYISDITYRNIFISSFAGSIIFFLITNFGTWVIGYPKTINGFLSCFTLALPFYKNTLLSSLFYSTIFYLLYESLLKINLNSLKNKLFVEK